MRKVYLAGPFFNPRQIGLVKTFETILARKGLKVYSPRKHQSKASYGSMKWRRQTFASDVRAIDSTDVVFAIYNGEDSGTMWEIGHAWSRRKPVLVFNSKEKRVNLMIAQSLHAYLDSVEKVEKYNFTKCPRIPYRGPII